MADQVVTTRSSLPADDVIVRAVQFFSSENWRPTSQSQRTATFQGKPPIPWLYMLLTIAGFVACVVPGIIMYILVIKKMYRFQNLIVTANILPEGSEVVVQCPASAIKVANRFIAALPGKMSAA